MVSERLQRQIDRLLDEAELATNSEAWDRVIEVAQRVLAMDAANADALGFVAMARGAGASGESDETAADQHAAVAPHADMQSVSIAPLPTSFAAGRYHVRRSLGAGRKKKVLLAHDQLCAARTSGDTAAGVPRGTEEIRHSISQLTNVPHI